MMKDDENSQVNSDNGLIIQGLLSMPQGRNSCEE